MLSKQRLVASMNRLWITTRCPECTRLHNICITDIDDYSIRGSILILTHGDLTVNLPIIEVFTTEQPHESVISTIELIDRAAFNN
jgi:hypothetical protein